MSDERRGDDVAENREHDGNGRDGTGDDGAARSARRAFLRTGLGAAAGAAAATAAGVVGAGPAGAANGDPVNVGQTNSGTATTTLSGSQLSVTNGNGVVSVKASHTAANSLSVQATNSGNGGTAVYAWADSANSLYGVWAKSSGSTAVLGESTASGGNARGVEGQALSAGIGVWGESVEGVGVYGTSPNGSGVYGRTDAVSNGVGVWGQAIGANSTGVRGTSFSGPAVSAYSVAGPTLHLSSNALTFPTNVGTWNDGDVVFGANNALWLCIVGGAGQASKWIKLSRVFQPLDVPVRIYDSRAGFNPAGVTKGKIGAGQERVIDATFGGAVPAGLASAVQVNLTIVGSDGNGWLSLFKNGVAWPGTSTINWNQPDTVLANGTTTAVDAGATFKVRSSGATDFLVDVTGYYT